MSGVFKGRYRNAKVSPARAPAPGTEAKRFFQPGLWKTSDARRQFYHVISISCEFDLNLKKHLSKNGPFFAELPVHTPHSRHNGRLASENTGE
jgi:hypothetical protein